MPRSLHLTGVTPAAEQKESTSKQPAAKIATSGRIRLEYSSGSKYGSVLKDSNKGRAPSLRRQSTVGRMIARAGDATGGRSWKAIKAGFKFTKKTAGDVLGSVTQEVVYDEAATEEAPIEQSMWGCTLLMGTAFMGPVASLYVLFLAFLNVGMQIVGPPGSGSLSALFTRCDRQLFATPRRQQPSPTSSCARRSS